LEIKLNSKSSLWISLFLVVLLFSLAGVVQAQDEQPEGPVYIVQSGDTLWAISQRFGISMDDLAGQNGLTDPSQLSIGARLVIPGLEGLNGILVTETVLWGETLESLSRQYQVSKELLVRLNHFTSPIEVYAGSSLVVPQSEDGEPARSGGRATLKVDQSPMELAISQGVSPWTLLKANQLPGSWSVLPGETLSLPEGESAAIGVLPEVITSIEVNALPLTQGRTMVLNISASGVTSLFGQFQEQKLNFFPMPDGRYAALQGIYVLLEPGLYPLSIRGSLADGAPFGLTQYVYVQDGNYPFDPPLRVDSETTDIENNETENALWAEIVAPVTPEKYWQDAFESPVAAVFNDCFPSRFGNRRSYNESGYNFFHSGLDFCGSVGNDIYAPAPGRVVFVGPLTIRGNATVIDHGWGVYSAYGHQSAFLVNQGDWVETGQLIGKVGETGRVSGPHLHWEIIVGGIQVDPLLWLSGIYP
jgi:murein DD-endopeptidase MepM/ murein hydrolase activator NlpD